MAIVRASSYSSKPCEHTISVDDRNGRGVVAAAFIPRTSRRTGKQTAGDELRTSSMADMIPTPKAVGLASPLA